MREFQEGCWTRLSLGPEVWGSTDDGGVKRERERERVREERLAEDLWDAVCLIG